MSLRSGGPIYDFFTEDHRRLDLLFEAAIRDLPQVDLASYGAFRVGLLTHIKMEETILFAAAQKANGGTPLPLQDKLRRDHGALTSLMVSFPTLEVINVIRHILEEHDRLEEELGGMYEACERLTENETEQILDRLKNVKPVPVHPFNEAPYVLEVIKRAVARADFDFDLLCKR